MGEVDGRATRRHAVWPDPRSRSRSRRSEICENISSACML